MWVFQEVVSGKSYVNEQFLSLAINSKYGCTQEQLHIHLACLKPEIYQIIRKNENSITASWQPLKEKINNHQYITYMA